MTKGITRHFCDKCNMSWSDDSLCACTSRPEFFMPKEDKDRDPFTFFLEDLVDEIGNALGIDTTNIDKKKFDEAMSSARAVVRDHDVLFLSD